MMLLLLHHLASSWQSVSALFSSDQTQIHIKHPTYLLHTTSNEHRLCLMYSPLISSTYSANYVLFLCFSRIGHGTVKTTNVWLQCDLQHCTRYCSITCITIHHQHSIICYAQSISSLFFARLSYCHCDTRWNETDSRALGHICRWVHSNLHSAYKLLQHLVLMCEKPLENWPPVLQASWCSPALITFGITRQIPTLQIECCWQQVLPSF